MDLSLYDRHCETRLILNPDSLGGCMSGSRLKSHNTQDVPLVECVIRGLQGTGGIKLREWFMVWLICTGIRLTASPSLQHLNRDLRTYYHTQAVAGCRMKMRPSPRVAWRTNCAAGLPQGEFQSCLMHYDFSLTSLQCVSFSLYWSLFSSLQISRFLFRDLSFSLHGSSSSDPLLLSTDLLFTLFCLVRLYRFLSLFISGNLDLALSVAIVHAQYTFMHSVCPR